jgi:hypothetical protein
MPNLAYERLQEIGSFGLSEAGRVDEILHNLGGGFYRSILIGPRQPLRRWTFVYKVLPGTMDGPVQTTEELLESRADYLWNIFFRSKFGYPDTNRPIIVTSPRDGKDYLAIFKDSELSYEMFMTKLFRSQVELREVRVRGVSTLEDGSQGESGNNAEI